MPVIRQLFPAAVLLLSPGAVSAEATWKFDFGDGPQAPGYLAVHAGDRFDSGKGYGFDLAGRAEDVHQAKGDPLTSDHVTGKGGFYFSLAVPEGNYEVTLLLGAAGESSDTTVKAESRRLMLEDLHTAAGQTSTQRFTVNIRQPAIAGGDTVRLKDREKPYLHWDSKLTLEFNGEHPCIAAMEIREVSQVTTVYVLGDSTVTDQPYEPWNSWGQMLPRFFDASVAIANHAESGESLKSSLSARRVEKVCRSLKPGDYVLIQFGHNDMKDKAPDALETYRGNLTELAARVKKLGGHPILLTSMERKAGVNNDTLGGYPDAVRSVAKAGGIPLIDLHVSSRTLYQALGDKLPFAFQDGTHHNNYGSYELAKCVVRGIRQQAPELARHIRDDVKPFNPASPDDPAKLHLPASPLKDPAKPDGD